MDFPNTSDFNSRHDKVNPYLLLIDLVEQVKLDFFTNKEFTYATKLLHCCAVIDEIIIEETGHCNFLAICQLKEQFTMLIIMMDELVQSEINTTYFMSVTECKKNYNLQYPFTQTEVKDHKNKYKSILASSTVVPKTCGLSEIIGLQDVKKILKTIVMLPKTQPQLFYNRRLCNSILLYGPPGTGKTQLTHALAAEACVNFHCISAGDILSHYVGQTEKTIKCLFQALKTSSEYRILFIDEIDALCRKRSQSEQEHTRRIKTEFMCQMSSIENCRNIIMIGATNCPWDLDSAILRRFQKHLYIPLPNELERLDLLKYLTNNNNFEDSLDLSLVVEKTFGYSGSDLFEVIQTAMTLPLNELEDTKIWKYYEGFYEPLIGGQDFFNVICCELRDLPPNSVRARKVQLNDLLNAVESVKCTVMQHEIKMYDFFKSGLGRV